MEEGADLVLSTGFPVRFGASLPPQALLVVRAQRTPHPLLRIPGRPAAFSQILTLHL